MQSIRESLSNLPRVISSEYGRESKEHHKNMIMYRFLVVVWLIAIINIIVVPVGWIFFRWLNWLLWMYTGVAVIVWVCSIYAFIAVNKDEY